MAVRKAILAAATAAAMAGNAQADGLWTVYDQHFVHARYIDLTHTIAPDIPVWHGFGPSAFKPSVDPKIGRAYDYKTDGFAATHYDLSTDQLGTQLDPPAHWAPEYPSIDELPPTYSLRKLVVISIVPQVKKNWGYQMTVADVRTWEKAHGPVPAGSVVFIRSDWSKRWPDPKLTAETQFPGVTLAALQYLHLTRYILFHGHEALDTDTTPTLEGEAWLMHHGYAQAEGVANLDHVPETGCLVAFGFPKLKGGTGGYARYIAICPEDTAAGVSPSATDAPLPRGKPLHWDAKAGTRVR
jgi:kynurenine formamidase